MMYSIRKRRLRIVINASKNGKWLSIVHHIHMNVHHERKIVVNHIDNISDFLQRKKYLLDKYVMLEQFPWFDGMR